MSTVWYMIYPKSRVLCLGQFRTAARSAPGRRGKKAAHGHELTQATKVCGFPFCFLQHRKVTAYEPALHTDFPGKPTRRVYVCSLKVLE